ncbi:MAG: cytochrome c [Planctomycetes bacterium]|nr:cytochrome c [Planctomycetota bacterium]
MRDSLRPVISAFALAVALLAFVGCSDEKDSRGIDYMPDMYVTPAEKSQYANAVALGGERKDERIERPLMSEATGGEIHHVPVMLMPPAGTVSRDFMPYPLEATDFAGAKKLVNPYLPTADVLRRGQKYYNISCAPCHGNDGNAANGYVAKHFTGVLSLNGPSLNLLSDGEIYHILTNGRARMPNYRAQLLPENRWAVVHYVRVLNRATLALTNADKDLASAEAALKKTPKDAAAEQAVVAAKAVAAKAKGDLKLIQAGERAGADAFRPEPEAMPESVTPTWPGSTDP